MTVTSPNSLERFGQKRETVETRVKIEMGGQREGDRDLAYPVEGWMPWVADS